MVAQYIKETAKITVGALVGLCAADTALGYQDVRRAKKEVDRTQEELEGRMHRLKEVKSVEEREHANTLKHLEECKTAAQELARLEGEKVDVMARLQVLEDDIRDSQARLSKYEANLKMAQEAEEKARAKEADVAKLVAASRMHLRRDQDDYAKRVAAFSPLRRLGIER